MVFLEEPIREVVIWEHGVISVAPGMGWIDPLRSFMATMTIVFADGHAETHRWTTDNVIQAATDASSGVTSVFNWGGGNASILILSGCIITTNIALAAHTVNSKWMGLLNCLR